MDTPVYQWDLDHGSLTPKNAIHWLEQKGYAASEWHDHSGSVYNDFIHEMDEIVWLIKGDAEMEMDGKVFSLKPGGGIFIPGKLPHTLRIKGNGQTVYVAGYLGYSPYS